MDLSDGSDNEDAQITEELNEDDLLGQSDDEDHADLDLNRAHVRL